MKFLIFFLFPFLLVSCQSPNKKVTHLRGIAHTLPYHIQIGKDLSHHEKKKAKAAIDDTFAEIDTLYNHWNPNSELSLLNQHPAGHALPLSPYLKDVLLLAQSFSLLTEGRYDPTLGTIIQKWKTSLKAGTVPTCLNLPSGWKHFELQNQTITKDCENISFDLDGMIKGYAVDRLIEKLQACGFSDLYVDWGGDIRVTGKHPVGRSWRVLLHSFTTEAEVLSLDNCALASSGDYEQIWQTEKGSFSHILDPLSKQAIKREEHSLAAVTVRAPSCALADALATACMTFPNREAALKWANQLEKQNPEINFWIVSYEPTQD